jgi:hypothetical protein
VEDLLRFKLLHLEIILGHEIYELPFIKKVLSDNNGIYVWDNKSGTWRERDNWIDGSPETG